MLIVTDILVKIKLTKYVIYSKIGANYQIKLMNMKNIDGINKEEKKEVEKKITIHQYSSSEQNNITQNNITNHNKKVTDSSIQNQQEKKQATNNFLQQYPQELSTFTKNKQKKWRLFFLIFLLIVTLFCSFLFSNYLSVNKTTGGLGFALQKLNLWQQLNKLIGIKKDILTNDRDRINVLLMGMGGEGHDGPYLTDTIILLSLKPSTKQTAMISIPRDLVIKYSDGYYPRINEIYTLAIKNQVLDPAAYTAELIGTAFNQPIDYYAVIDFSGFQNIVDYLGGVELIVDNAFTDYQYPTNDHKYQTISFTAGAQTMDGLTALQFARSRHGNNGEGSDFARSRRQQKVIMAVKDKILSYNLLLNPYKLNRLYTMLRQYIKTNIDIDTAFSFYGLSKDLNSTNIIQKNIDDGPDGLLTSVITEQGAYVLQPKNNYTDLQAFVDTIFQDNIATSENAIIDIQNGTNISGLAYTIAQKLKERGINNSSYHNAATRDYQQTIIYDLSKGEKEKTKTILQKILPQATFTNTSPVTNSNTQLPDSVDFVIILGQDASNVPLN